jgi:hypothetical protein
VKISDIIAIIIGVVLLCGGIVMLLWHVLRKIKGGIPLIIFVTILGLELVFSKYLSSNLSFALSMLCFGSAIYWLFSIKRKKGETHEL